MKWKVATLSKFNMSTWKAIDSEAWHLDDFSFCVICTSFTQMVHRDIPRMLHHCCFLKLTFLVSFFSLYSSFFISTRHSLKSNLIVSPVSLSTVFIRTSSRNHRRHVPCSMALYLFLLSRPNNAHAPAIHAWCEQYTPSMTMTYEVSLRMMLLTLSFII